MSAPRLRRAVTALGTAAALVLGLAAGPDVASADEQTPASDRPATTFNLATFNVLGSQHTGPRSGYASGTKRARWAARLLLERKLGIVGFQEIQPDQLEALTDELGARYATYPGTGLGYQGVPQNLVWNTRRWTRTKATTITVPFLGQPRIQPAVRLRSTVTGRQIWVVNVHNAPRNHQAERDEDRRIEIDLVNRLGAHGLPVFLIGDLNETVNAFCSFTGSTALASPLGGSNGEDGCLPPRGMRIDWLLGSRSTFAGYLVDRSDAVARITDHPVISARVTLVPR